MFKYVIAFAMLFSASRLAAEDSFQIGLEDLASRPTLCVVPEMGLIPELDTWESCRDADVAQHAEAFHAAWLKQRPWVARHLTPAVARAISRWAKPQMEKYLTVPGLDKLAFTPVTTHKGRGLIVYEATVDHLPVHAALVKRWLKVYVLYSTQETAILRVTITIRGTREE